MDLQCSKWHIGLKIEDFVFFTSILPKILPFLHLFELSYPIYGLHSTVLVLFHLHNHFVSPFMDLQCFNWKIGLKMDDFVFLAAVSSFILRSVRRSVRPSVKKMSKKFITRPKMLRLTKLIPR